MIRFKMEIAGSVEMDRGFQRFAELVEDWTPVWPVMREAFFAMEERQFQSEGEQGGERWVPLSLNYAEWKEIHFPARGILQRSGELAASLTSSASPYAVYSAGPQYLTLGSSVPYGIFHQARGPRSGHLPRRPEIVFTEKFKREFVKIMQRYAVNLAKQWGYEMGISNGWRVGYESSLMQKRLDYLIGGDN